MEGAKDLGVLHLASFDLLPHLRGASALPPQTPDPKGPNSTKSFLSPAQLDGESLSTSLRLVRKGSQQEGEIWD